MKRTFSSEQIASKKERPEREGKANMAHYREQQRHALDRMARLRAQRLATERNTPAEPAKAKNEERSPPAASGLHQDARE